MALDPSVIVAVLALVSSLAGIVIANRFTARSARQATEITAEIERKKLDASSWAEQVKSWKDDVVQLRRDRAEDAAKHENEVAKLQTRIDAMEDEMRSVNRQSAHDRAAINAMVAWSRIVVVLMRDAGIIFPAPPPVVTEAD